jgi:hypothetical protein
VEACGHSAHFCEKLGAYAAVVIVVLRFGLELLRELLHGLLLLGVELAPARAALLDLALDLHPRARGKRATDCSAQSYDDGSGWRAGVVAERGRTRT